ncbi:MAG: hypothetical protein ACOYNZ_15265 [Rhodoferax sp.]
MRSTSMLAYTRCPKCGHSPLPVQQSSPAACPHCGVIFAKLAGLAGAKPRPADTGPAPQDSPAGWRQLLTDVPQPVDRIGLHFRVALLLGFAIWAWILIRLDYRTGEMGASFIHRPLLVFHEAGHILFLPLGRWMSVLGGTLMQLIMPAIMAAALLIRNRDPFGAALGLWFFGVSLLDLAPYMFDALQPQLMLLSGATGEDGGHDWIFLFSSMGLLPRAQMIGGLAHKLGALTVLSSLAWAAHLLWRQRQRARPDPMPKD